MTEPRDLLRFGDRIGWAYTGSGLANDHYFLDETIKIALPMPHDPLFVQLAFVGRVAEVHRPDNPKEFIIHVISLAQLYDEPLSRAAIRLVLL